MNFRNTVIEYAEQLAKRPTAYTSSKDKRHVKVVGTSVEIEIPVDNARDKLVVRQERRLFRQTTLQKFRKYTAEEKFKMSVLVRAARGGSDCNVLQMVQFTQPDDISCVFARSEELLAGLALAETQNVELNANWSQSAKYVVSRKKI